jgi:aminoglycoside phosphotransferase (APT) family kinase protein
MGEISPTISAESRLQAWIEQHVGPVVRMELQPRWRAAWLVDVERDGKILPLYVKGAREVHALVPVEREGAALDILHRNGVAAPRQYGYCAEVDAIVMERLPGESRLENIADVAVRDHVADQYVQAMAQFHALDPKLFVDAGFAMPTDKAGLRLAQFNKIEQMYLGRKRAPEACNEFLRLWVRRNVPTGDIEPAFITGDAFQMMYHEGELKAVMDLEMACIGDPLLDICCIRMRDLSEKTGSAAALTKRYAELSGRPIDMKALRFHLVAFSAVSSLLISDVYTQPAPETDYFEYFIYYWGSLRIALEGMAEFLEVTLEPFTEPEPATTQQSVHLGMLANAISQIDTPTDMDRYRLSKVAAETAYLDRVNRFGAKLDAAYLADVCATLGIEARDPIEAEAKLEAFVHEAGPDWDAKLLGVFHCQSLRQCFLADIPQNGRLRRFLREPIASLD